MNQVATIEQPKRSILVSMASRYGMEPRAFEATVRATCMPNQNVTQEQFAAFLLVAKEYDLNPVLKEIYAFPTRGGGIQPIVGVDGWANLINSRPECDGIEFEDHLDDQGALTAVTCRIYRKDRGRPTTTTEYMAECKRNTDTWKQWPRRMLRHKALIQAARYAFGFSGIVEPDEWERSPENARDVTPPSPPSPPSQPPAAIEHHQESALPHEEPEQAAESEGEAAPPPSPASPEDPAAEFDPDKWLDDLDTSMCACTDEATLNEVWDAEGQSVIEEGHVFPPDRQRASDLYAKHLGRFVE